MRATPAAPESATRPGTSSVHQLYVTHCLFEEGLARQAGFGVRATSTRDPLLLRLAQEYPAYELPPGLAPDELTLPVAPRRLALLRLPNGVKALIHSVALPRDRRGRANNFFSHCVFSPSLTPREALAAWRALGWVTDCAPDAGRDLPHLAGTPTGGPLDDDTLTAFLQLDDLGNQDVPWPARLTDGRVRRRLLAWTLRGCLHVLQAGPGTPRGRLYLLAEPDLVALLLYGALRLLPPSLTSELTFSTYEPARHTLRTFRQAQVVGTLLANPERGLDPDYFQARGYAIDSFAPKASPELDDGDDLELDAWIEQAARGEWKVLDRIYALLGRATTTAVPLREGFQAAKLIHRLTSGQPSAADLLVLKGSPWGAGLLKEHHDKLWPLIRNLSLTNAEIREAYSDLLAGNLHELEQQVAEALNADPPGDWKPGWRLLERALVANPARWRDALQRILPSPPYAPGLRFALLQEMRDAQFAPGNQQQPLHVLLRRCSAEELEQFARSSLPRDWFAWALCYAIVRSETRTEAVAHLRSSDNELLHAFWDQVRQVKDEQQRRAILSPLLAGGDEPSRTFFGRSLQVGCPLRPDTLLWILDTLGALEPAWTDFWCLGNHLVCLLELLRELGPEVQPVWDGLTARLNQDLLLLANPFQTHLLTALAAVRDRPGASLPASTAGVVADWVLLRDHFERACAVPDPVRVEVAAACTRRGVDAIRILRDYFRRYVMPQEISLPVLDDFAGFFHSFYPESDGVQQYHSRLHGWLEVVRVCPDELKRAAYRTYYVDQQIPEAFRVRVAEETPTPVALPPGELPPLSPEAGDPFHGAVEQLAGADTAGPLSAEAGERFQLTGVRLSPASSLLVNFLRNSPWALCGLAAGLAVVLLLKLLPIPLSTAPLPPKLAIPADRLLWLLFLPLLVLAADGVALQAEAVVLGLVGQAFSRRARLLQGLRVGLMGGAAVGLVAGLLVLGLALTLGSATTALGLAVAVAAAVLQATLLGFVLPLLLGADRGSRLATGPITRALVGVLAVALHVALARLFLR